MTDFEILCKQFESLDPASYSSVFEEKSIRVVKALEEISEEGETGLDVFKLFIIEAVTSDGKLEKKEFELIRPALETMTGKELHYKDVKARFEERRKKNDDDRHVIKQMKDVLDKTDDDLRNDIILVIMMVCAVDGEISYKEKLWIKEVVS